MALLFVVAYSLLVKQIFKDFVVNQYVEGDGISNRGYLLDIAVSVSEIGNINLILTLGIQWGEEGVNIDI